MKISPTFYNNDGELLAPLPIDVKMANSTLGGIPAVEAGFYYLFAFEGRTKADYRAKYERFFRNMQAVAGYMTLTQREYKVEMDSFVRYGVEVLYAVEDANGPRNGPWNSTERFQWRMGITPTASATASPSAASTLPAGAPSMLEIILGKR